MVTCSPGGSGLFWIRLAGDEQLRDRLHLFAAERLIERLGSGVAARRTVDRLLARVDRREQRHVGLVPGDPPLLTPQAPHLGSMPRLDRMDPERGLKDGVVLNQIPDLPLVRADPSVFQ